MKKSLIIIGILGLTGCSVAIGGSGTTKDNSPIVGEIIADTSGTQTIFRIASPQGWMCESKFKPEATQATPTATTTLPLACNNGATGTAIVASHGFERKLVGTFKLSNGIEGSVTF